MTSNSVKITAMIIGTILVLALAAGFILMYLSPGQTISVDGMSELQVVPDKISLNFNVITSGKTSQEANDANSLVVDSMLISLIKLGFERKDIQTTGFNIYEDIDYTTYGRKSLGYKATHSIIVTIPSNKSELVGRTIDAAIDANATLAYVNFELSQELENKYKAEAIKLASQDATLKAEAMASGLGKSVGRIVSITDSSFNYMPYRAYDNVMGATAMESKLAVTSIQPSEQSVSSQVRVVYKLK